MKKLFLCLASASLFLTSCETHKERVGVPPPVESESNIPWNDQSLLPPSGGLLGGALSR